MTGAANAVEAAIHIERLPSPGGLDGRPRLRLLRHAQTEWSEAGRYQGKSDPPLSEAGVSQARALAATLAPIFACHVVLLSSPLARARMTAEIIGARYGAPVTLDDRLAELDYGDWEGRTQAAVKSGSPEALRQWKRAPDTVEFSGGGSLRRVRDAWLSLIKDLGEAPRSVLAVTHDGPIRVALLEALGLPLSQFRTVRTEPGGLAVLNWGDAGPELARTETDQ